MQDFFVWSFLDKTNLAVDIVISISNGYSETEISVL